MLRDNYKKAFSQINPSEETIERIFEMTEKKRSKKIRKGLIIAIAIIVTLLCGVLTANAASNGALFDGISNEIGFKINGEDVEDLTSRILKSFVDKGGTGSERYQIDLDGDGEVDSVLEIEGDGTGWTVIVYANPDYDISVYDVVNSEN